MPADSLAPDTKILVFNAPRPIETMFYLNHTTAYGFTISKEVEDSLRNEGYQIYEFE
ncbi:MAG TPA: hypothetical protein VJ953_11585 [Saprospiraceae bacterium]|nr:hypothetical protein [Saprospiraceae bacterium]